ncbi:MAG: replication-associated recombination protein A [Limnobacter sp.]|nr:replication-associated recombination protein A [Limnobacter sp.]
MANLGLFDGESPADSAPLAERLRPKTLQEVIGQTHLLGEGMPLHQVLQGQKPHSMILWGPPGVGKTTLALLLAQSVQSEFIALSAVFSGVKDIRQATEQAKAYAQTGRKTVLFIDEIHRFNKSQQDALLPFVESGLLTFIGATTENPSFEVNSALLSRSQVYVLKSFSEEDFRKLLNRVNQHSGYPIEVVEPAFQALCAQADGDARRFLNLIQIALEALQSRQDTFLTSELLSKLVPAQLRRFDKGGDSFYDQISALHKSVRGSDPDAALYWFCRMLEAGTDPRYLSRRLVRMAWEDIGLADPRAIQLANDAASTYERLGSPEGDLALAECVIYLAIAAKSNAAYSAFKSAMAEVKKGQSHPVPMHLRNAPTQLMKQLGHGANYRYAHDEPDGLAAGESYWPEGMGKPKFYKPVNRGLETKIAEKLRWLSERNNESDPSGADDS